MKYIRSLGIVTTFVFLAGCSTIRLPFFNSTPAPSVAEVDTASQAASRQLPGQVKVSDGEADVLVQTVDFRPGLSSATVERLAKRFGCTGTQGAGLITDKGPVEVYRMKCDNGTIFMAQCELRQCRPMR